jgi:hypothetical protein
MQVDDMTRILRSFKQFVELARVVDFVARFPNPTQLLAFEMDRHGSCELIRQQAKVKGVFWSERATGNGYETKVKKL